MHILRHTLIAVGITTALALAACSSGKDQAAADHAGAATGPTPAATAAKPLTAGEVDVQMTLQGAPTLSADGQSVDVTVNLANHGKTTLASTGPYPVNLGAHSASASGAIVDNDLARASVPATPPNGQATIIIKLPVDKIMGNNVQILPVQEHVAWFDHWGTKPLVVGPFKNCASTAMGKVCNADGKPLSSSPAH